MSLDYPLYEEMLRRKSRAAIWWRVGDSFYYLGLLVAIFSIIIDLGHSAFSTIFNSSFNHLWYLLAFVSGAVVFIAGVLLKRRSYTLAERDGIDPSRY